MLVAISGGADSTALLLALHRLRHEFGLSLHAAHLHHGLRGADADADLAFVRALCARLKVPLVAGRWDTRARMKRRGLSGQAGLRTLRREFVAAAARRVRASAIATAHTADDQLETLLMRLVRGTGLRGLGAMRERRGAWIKPMLECTREDIERDLGVAGQSWREDRSNADADYLRNRIRHDVVPRLVAAGRAGSRAALARHAAAATREVREAHAVLERTAVRISRHALATTRDGWALDFAALRNCPPALRRQVVRLAWRRHAGGGAGLTGREVAGLLALAAGGRGDARVRLPLGAHATCERGHLRITRSGIRHEPEDHATRVLPTRGRVRVEGGSLRGRWSGGAAARRELGRRREGQEFFASESLSGTLELRRGLADEWFTPFGRSRPVRLAQFLKKQPVSRQVKSRPVVLADAEGILWIVGVRRSARAPITDSTRKALLVHLESHD